MHRHTQTGHHYINNPYPAQDRSGPREQKKNKRKRRWGGLRVWFCEALTIRTEKEREKPGLLNLKQCWGHEDDLLFIATDFLFKRALLLCFLSHACAASLAPRFYSFSIRLHIFSLNKRRKTLTYTSVNVNYFLKIKKVHFQCPMHSQTVNHNLQMVVFKPRGSPRINLRVSGHRTSHMQPYVSL